MTDAKASQTRVKICGTTSVADAVMSAQAGADALGFIFAPGSKRQVSAEVARAASLSVGPVVARVGVFMRQGLNEVLRLAEQSRMTTVQLHGTLSPAYIEAVSEYYPVLRAVRPAELDAEKALWAGKAAVTLLLDAPEPGSGQPLDWGSLQTAFPAGSWLAGGLGPANVAQAMRLLRPAAVDAVSKLEASPGVKNPQMVQAFIDAVKNAN